MHYFASPDSSPFPSPLLPTAAQAPVHIFLSIIIDCGYSVAWKFPHVSKVWAPQETMLSTFTTIVWMNMNDYDKIWRRSESLIKGGQPVTYGNVSQWISGCPGFSFLLLCCWWLSVPDLSCWSLSSSHKWTHIQALKVTVLSSLASLPVRLWFCWSLRHFRKMEGEGTLTNKCLRTVAPNKNVLHLDSYFT